MVRINRGVHTDFMFLDFTYNLHIFFVGMDNSLMHPMSSRSSSVNGSVSMSHHNGYHSYSRSNSQRAAALEIHFKFGQLGSSACQFGSPHGFCIAVDDSIIVADTNNHRIQVKQIVL